MPAAIMTFNKHAQMQKERASEVEEIRYRQSANTTSASSFGRNTPTQLTSPEPKQKETKGLLTCIIETVNSNGLQAILYVTFVTIFQMLATSMRHSNEYMFDKAVMARLVDNHFDTAHNTFSTIRRVADVYEWGNRVLWPGLFGDFGPCDDNVGSQRTNKSCIDDAWPDGEGIFGMSGATPYDVNELIQRMDLVDWTEGLLIRQVRAASAECSTTLQLGQCYPDLKPLQQGSQDAYGYNWTLPGAEPSHLWRHFNSSDLGGNPAGVLSAAIPSLKRYDAGGFVAFVLPFFSETYLPDESGSAHEVSNAWLDRVNASNGKTARFACVRLSPNGEHVRQLCDPGTNGDGTGRMTGAVRVAVEEMWGDLKRGHFIDMTTRMVSIMLPLKSNHAGIRYRLTLMLELTSLGAILPSFDVESRPLDSSMVEAMYRRVGQTPVLMCRHIPR